MKIKYYLIREKSVFSGFVIWIEKTEKPHQSNTNADPLILNSRMTWIPYSTTLLSLIFRNAYRNKTQIKFYCL